MKLLAAKSSISINVGLGEITGRASRDLIDKGDVSNLNLDCTLCGGVAEWQRVADMERMIDVEIVHHEEPQVAVHLVASNPHGLFC